MTHSCNFFANGNFQIVDCTRFSNVDFWFEVTPKKEIAGKFKNMRSIAPPCIIEIKRRLGSVYWKCNIFPCCRNMSNKFLGVFLYIRSRIRKQVSKREKQKNLKKQRKQTKTRTSKLLLTQNSSNKKFHGPVNHVTTVLIIKPQNTSFNNCSDTSANEWPC